MDVGIGGGGGGAEDEELGFCGAVDMIVTVAAKIGTSWLATLSRAHNLCKVMEPRRGYERADARASGVNHTR
jgi:hypothetical protein